MCEAASASEYMHDGDRGTYVQWRAGEVVASAVRCHLRRDFRFDPIVRFLRLEVVYGLNG